MSADIYRDVIEAVRLLFRPGDVIEVRVPKARRHRVISGFFTNHEKLAKAVVPLENGKYPGVYWTLNPVHRDLLSLADNKALPYAEASTKDSDILCRHWIPIDLDPKRRADISSTDEEHEAALTVTGEVETTLTSEGWPRPVRSDSGNGGHLLYAIDLPNDADSETLLKQALHGLAARFNRQFENGPLIQVDLTMYNASRICKIYGTTARKGDNTAERPHRRARILSAPAPGEIQPVSIELLSAIAAFAPKPQPVPPRSPVSRYSGPSQFSLREFLDRHGIPYRAPVPYDGGYKYTLEACPFDPSHRDKDAAVFERPDGYGFKCFHNSCADRGWKEFREHFEGPRPVRAVGAPREFPQSAPPLQAVPDPAGLLDAPPTPAVEPASEDAEAPLSIADIEAAIDHAIEQQSMAEVMRLAPQIAALRMQHQAVIAAKLRDGFKEEWKWFEKWFEKALKDARAGDETGQNPPAEPPAGEKGGLDGKPDLTGFPLTDSGNGQRIVALFGEDIRYCTEMETWFIWDGKRWATDRANLMRHKAMEMARLLYYQAGKLADGSMRTVLSKFARSSESSKGITNALIEARRMPGIPVSAHALDQYPDHLNFQNGTVYLRDGTIQPHKREMLLTKLCGYDYRPEAKALTFQIFVEWTMGGPEGGNPDAELPEETVRLVAFLQRVIGYSITGQVGEKAVFVFYGEGGDNGKTTLLTVFRELLGRDYASLLLIDTILHARSTDNTAREDMADLRGARFVQTSEISKEDRLNEQRVKFLTQGMGTIKSRRLHEHLIEFVATHKLLMDCNYRPKVTGQDNAIWRRLIQLPFNYTVSENRKDLKFAEKLKAEAEGMLAWAVRGAIEWYKSGLGKPPEVVEAGQEWREHDDPLREFLADWCDVGEGLVCPVSDLMPAYLLWAKENGEKFPLTRRGFNELLAGKGIKQQKNRVDLSYYGEDDREPVRYWSGVQLKIAAVRKVRRWDDTYQDSGRQTRLESQSF